MEDRDELRVPDVVNAGRGLLGRVRRLLRREKRRHHAIWISVARHEDDRPRLWDHVPADGKMHRLVWSAESPDTEVYVDGERVR